MSFFGGGSFFGGAFDTGSMKNQLKDDTSIDEQQMTPEEKQLLAAQMGAFGDMQKMAPVQLAQMGYIKGADGNIRPLTDQEAKTILAPDQYAMYQARQQDASNLAAGTIPDYMRRDMDRQNNMILGAANRRLGPGGYYTSTPGNQATRDVAQNVADTTARNRVNQLGLMSGYYGLNANIANQMTNPSTGLLSAGQSIAKNMTMPFHEWSSANRGIVSQVRGTLGGVALGVQGKTIPNFTYCWVAREVYGKDNPKWMEFRHWMLNSAPGWFRNMYVKYGERFAEYIKDKPLIKAIIRKCMEWIR